MLHRRYQDRGLRVYGVASRLFFGGETEATLAAFEDQVQVGFPILWDSGTYGDYDWPPATSPFPRQALIDADGTLIYLASEHRQGALEDAIRRALGADPGPPAETTAEQ